MFAIMNNCFPSKGFVFTNNFSFYQEMLCAGLYKIDQVHERKDSMWWGFFIISLSFLFFRESYCSWFAHKRNFSSPLLNNELCQTSKNIFLMDLEKSKI